MKKRLDGFEHQNRPENRDLGFSKSPRDDFKTHWRCEDFGQDGGGGAPFGPKFSYLLFISRLPPGVSDPELTILRSVSRSKAV